MSCACAICWPPRHRSRRFPLPSQAALAEALLTGAVDAVIGSYGLEYWRASNAVLGFGPKRMRREGQVRLGISIRKDWPALVGILNKGLAAISAEESAALHRRWFGRDDLFAGGVAPVELSADEQAWIADHPLLRVASIRPGRRSSSSTSSVDHRGSRSPISD